MRICPRCTKVLEEVTACGVRIEGCHGCGGAWFDQGELTEVAKADPGCLTTIDEQFSPNRAYTPAERPLNCPVCNRRLATFEFRHFPGIPARGCSQCKGVWMDHGELAAIAARLTGAPKPPSR
jgi:Zn-finger nucleic acid-binding protein